MKTIQFPLFGTFFSEIQKFQKELDLHSVTPERAEQFASKISQLSQKIFANKALCESGYTADVAAERAAIFDRLEVYEREGIEDDAHLVEAFDELATDADLVAIQFDLLSPQEIKEKCDLLMQRWQNLSKKKAYNERYISSFSKNAFQKIHHLKFRIAYPILEELSLCSYHSNFAKDLINKKIELSPYQRSWLAFYMKQDMSTQSNLSLQEIYHHSLVNLVELAESISINDGSQSILRFNRLSEAEKDKIQTLLWEMQIPDMEGLLIRLQQNDEKTKEILSYVIMQMVEQLVV